MRPCLVLQRASLPFVSLRVHSQFAIFLVACPGRYYTEGVAVYDVTDPFHPKVLSLWLAIGCVLPGKTGVGGRVVIPLPTTQPSSSWDLASIVFIDRLGPFPPLVSVFVFAHR